MYTQINLKMKLRLILLSLFFLAIYFGCRSKQETQQIVGESPPSLKAKVDEQKSQIVTLSDENAKRLNIQTITVEKTFAQFSLQVPGIVEPAPENIAYISTPISGKIAKIYAFEGENVQKGQLLLEIESLEYGNLVSELLQSKAELDYQQSQIERLEKLTEMKISSKSELEKARADYEKALTNFRAAQSKLLAIGVRQSEIEKILSGNSINPYFKIYAPISGKIDKHFVEIGRAVNALENLISIIDLSKVLIRGFVSPEDANLIKVGSKVCVIDRNKGTFLCNSTISTINPALDEKNKSVVVNIIARPNNDLLKPGMNVQLEISVQTSEPMFKIPVEAITYEKNNPVVFVKLDKNKFEKRFINIYRIVGNYILVNQGINEKEDVVVSQVFNLKALGRFEEFAE